MTEITKLIESIKKELNLFHLNIESLSNDSNNMDEDCSYPYSVMDDPSIPYIKYILAKLCNKMRDTRKMLEDIEALTPIYYQFTFTNFTNCKYENVKYLNTLYEKLSEYNRWFELYETLKTMKTMSEYMKH